MAKLIQKYGRGLLNSDIFFEQGKDLLKPAQQEVLSQTEECLFTSLVPWGWGTRPGQDQGTGLGRCSVSSVQVQVSEPVQIAYPFSKE